MPISLVAELPPSLYRKVIAEVEASGLSLDEWVARSLTQSVMQAENFRRMMAKELVA